MQIRRMRRVRHEHGASGDGDTDFVEIDTRELSGMFATPTWLRDLGVMAWLLVGVAGVLVGAVWLLALTSTIVIPVVTAAILASVLAPVVRWLSRHRIPRAAAAGIVLLMIVVAGAAIGLLVLGGISAEAGSIKSQLQSATTEVEGWLKDLGVSSQTAADAKSDANGSVSNAFHLLVGGLGKGLTELASLAVFLSFTVLSLFFLLKDGPVIRRWLERHLGVPDAVARTISGRTIGSLRGYFAGVTAVAAFNGIVIGLGALILGVPLAGSIAVVNFVAAYIPYIGAWTAGGFTVLLALGDGGAETALVMGIIVLLANGALQQLIQPIAFGAALGIHPLAVLIVTIAGGALFGTIGLIVAAPLTSAAVKIAADVARARPEQGEGTAEPAPPEPSAAAPATPA
jgi:predicted PurR-regulated permease PerM